MKICFNLACIHRFLFYDTEYVDQHEHLNIQQCAEAFKTRKVYQLVVLGNIIIFFSLPFMSLYEHISDKLTCVSKILLQFQCISTKHNRAFNHWKKSLESFNIIRSTFSYEYYRNIYKKE